MLLYSTILDVNENFDKNQFIESVIKWNKESKYPENIVRNCNWNGEHNIKFGDNNLWLDIQEYRNENLIAIRYEKKDQNGVIWDTDYILNFNEMKLAVQLYRSYSDDAIYYSSKYSSPVYIKQLMDEGVIKNDGDLKCTYDPIEIADENIDILCRIINKENTYNLPIVYVSKSFKNKYKVDVKELAYKLKGSAHILVQKDITSNAILRNKCFNKNEYYGAIGIYFPNGANKRFLQKSKSFDKKQLRYRVENAVIKYVAIQAIDELYTWDGVAKALLVDRLKSKKDDLGRALASRKKSNEELQAFIDEFDAEENEFNKIIDKLKNENDALRAENLGLRNKLNTTDDVGLLFYGNENESFPGEIKEFVLEAIGEKMENSKEGSRVKDVLTDVYEANPSNGLLSERREKIRGIFGGFDGVSPKFRSEMKKLGFSINEDGKHYKLVYNEDERYMTTLSKTSSDKRAAKNAQGNILRDMF